MTPSLRGGSTTSSRFMLTAESALTPQARDEPCNQPRPRPVIRLTLQHKRRIHVGQLKEEIKGNANEAIGKVKQESGNPETRSEGQMQEEKGELQEEKGEFEGALGNDI